MASVKIVTNMIGIKKTIIAKDPGSLANSVVIAQTETGPTYPDINNPKDGNKRWKDLNP